MKITINGQDYTAALDAVRPLTIERKLNEPSVCQLWLSLPANGSLATPLRNQSLAVTGDDGTYYFHRLHCCDSSARVCGHGDRRPALPDCDPGVERRNIARPIADASQQGATGESAGALMTSLGNSYGSNRIIDSRAFARRNNQSLCPGAGRAVEQECWTGRRAWRGRHIARSMAR